MHGPLQYEARTGRWWVETANGEPIDTTVSAPELLRICEGLPKNTAAVLIAAKLISEVRSKGGLFEFFFSPDGVFAPNGHAAFRRIGMTESAAILREAMETLGVHYPQAHKRRRQRMAGDWKYDAPCGEMADRLRSLSAAFYSSLGGKGAPLFHEAVRVHIEAQSAGTEPTRRARDA